MIYGFDDRLRIQRAGKIRLGEKRETTGRDGSKVERPVALDHFVVPPEVAAVYGERPRKLDIMFPSENLEEVAGTSLRWYGSSGAPKCIGNGREATRFDEKTGAWHNISCPYQSCPVYQQGHCQEIASLRFILHRVPGAALSVYQLDTGSWNSTVNVKSTLTLLKSALGRISLIPLTLEVKMTETHPFVNGKRIKSVVPVLYLSTQFSFDELIELAMRRKLVQAVNIGEGTPALELPPVDMTKPEELYPADMNGGAIDEAPVDAVIGDAGDDITSDIVDPVSADAGADDVDPLDAQLEAAWDALNTPPMKRRAILGRPDLDKAKLLAALHAEIARRNASSNDPELVPTPVEESAPKSQGGIQQAKFF